MGEPLIEFVDIHKAFDQNVVLRGVNLAIPQGLVTTIIGRSGIGKSVLLKHVVGLLTPDSGEIRFHGRDLRRMSRSERRELKGKVSYMFQNNALFDSMTVFENIALPLEERTRMSKRDIRERVMRKIEQLELRDNENRYPAQLSGGMRKRVAFARALIMEPEIVLFDEPTTGLDPVRRQAVNDMIAHYQERFGYTAMIVSHDIPEVFEISQRVAMLDGGQILFEGTPAQILASTDPAVREFVYAGKNGSKRSHEKDNR